MSVVPYKIPDFIALPITFLASAAFSHEVKHYIYIKPHDPKLPDQDAPRSLFLVNIPVTTTELHLRHLFATQLSAGRVDRVEILDLARKTASNVGSTSNKTGRKRKRVTAEEIEHGLDQFSLPEVWPSKLNTSGSHALVVFVDRLSMESTMKAIKKATKTRTKLIWGKGIEERLPSTGLQRYTNHNRLKYPARKEILRCVDEYMSAYGSMKEAKAKENAKKRQVPDEDGFVTVTKGAAQKEEAKELGEKQKEKNKSRDFEDFYRFQMREKRKEQQGEMIRKFEQDKQRVAEMRERRGKLVPE